MNEESRASPAGDDELGEPIAELRGLAEDPSPSFTRRIHGAIQRRVLTGHLLDLGWTAPIAILREYATVVAEALRSAGTGKDEKP